MKVDRVTATIRFSQDSGKGAWKSVEIGAEATVAPSEDWHTAQGQLYQQLGQQMRAFWTNGNGKGNSQESPSPEAPAPKPEHWCEAHQTEYQRFSKDGKVWYSHKAPDGKWCREK